MLCPTHLDVLLLPSTLLDDGAGLAAGTSLSSRWRLIRSSTAISACLMISKPLMSSALLGLGHGEYGFGFGSGFGRIHRRHRGAEYLEGSGGG